MLNLFRGAPLDVYTHWLIFSLGLGILVTALAVLFSCRSLAAVLHLLPAGLSWHDRLYRGFYRYHGYYWVGFGFVLVFHLMTTAVHVGLPTAGEIAHGAHVGAFITSLTNLVLLAAVLTSCRTVCGLVVFFTSRNPLGSVLFRGFYRFHGLYWWLLALSVAGHIAFGLVHAVNT